MRIFPKNKKAASLSGWTEVALLSVLLLIAIIAIVTSLNNQYEKNFDGSFGFATTNTLNDYKNYQETLKSSVKSGEADTNSQMGISLTSSWLMIKAGAEITWTFVTGGWIKNMIDLIGFGELSTNIIIVLQILFVLSVGFIIIKLLLKVKP
jgi:hypothetical protein